MSKIENGLKTETGRYKPIKVIFEGDECSSEQLESACAKLTDRVKAATSEKPILVRWNKRTGTYEVMDNSFISDDSLILDWCDSKTVALDIEERAQYNLNGMAKTMVIEAFMDVLEKAGYYAVLYSYEAFLKTVPKSTLDKYDIWCANIVSKPSIRYGIWQYSFTGKIDGIHGDVDLDKTDKDYPKLMRDAGLNGYTKAKPVLDTAGFKSGDKSLGVLALKKLLSFARDKGMTSANFDSSHDGFFDGTEKAVNDILAKWGYKPNGIAGEKFIKRLGDELVK